MKQQLQAAWDAFEARAPREKALLLGALAALLLMLGDRLFTAPAWAQRKLAQAQAQQAEQALAQLRADMAAQAGNQQAARQAAQQEREQLQAELRRLQAERPRLLDGARMLGLMESLVERQQGRLKLLAMTSLPDHGLPDAAAAVADAASDAVPPARVYHHGLELVVSGRYEDLQAYLRALANEPLLRLRSFRFVVREHPQIELQLRVDTPSPDPQWLTL